MLAMRFFATVTQRAMTRLHNGRIPLLFALVVSLTISGIDIGANPQRSLATGQKVSWRGHSAAASKFTPDPNAPKYKLIFPTDYEIEFFTYKNRESVHPAKTISSRLKKFIELLNEAGADGYRLMTVVGDSTAIVKLGNMQYEYAGLDHVITYSPGAIDFATKYAPFAKNGFRIASQPLLRSDCVSTSVDDDDCDSYEFYIFERAKGVEKAVVFKNVFAYSDGKLDPRVPSRVNELRDAGFYPTEVLSSYDVMFQQTAASDERFSANSEVQIVAASNSYWGRDDLPKKIKLLANEGYRLALINNQLAVMYRPRGTARRISYVWLPVGERDWRLKKRQMDFQKELLRLHGSNAIYRMAYTGYYGDKNQLIFEENAAESNKPIEYRILRFGLKKMENIPARRVQVELTPSAKKAWSKLLELVDQGFEVRDLVTTDEPSALLERTAK